LLYARAARVVDADYRDAVLQRKVHDLDDLLREHLAQRPAEDRCVVAEQHHVTPADLGHARHDAVPRDALRLQSETGRAVDREDVELLERVAVDQARDALASGQLVLGVLAVEGLGVAVTGFVLSLPEQVERIDPVFWFWLVRHQVTTAGASRPGCVLLIA